MIMACIFPAVCIAIVALFWFLYGYFKKNSDATKKLITSIIILIFMTLPTVTTITFAIYNCIDVFGDGDTYLAVDMSL
jgi:ABC-type phosphate transport system permease subunit